MTARGQGNLPSNTKINPRDVKAITLRSGKELNSKDEVDTNATPKKIIVQEELNDEKDEETMGKV